jgi:acyl CoA:acetate/3-ketoacid CoA transferase alpha subunit
MNFADAVNSLHDGKTVARKGWNGKGMWLVKADRGTFEIDGKVGGNLIPFIVMKTADNKFVPWLASQSDVLSNDWEIVGEDS